MSGMQAQALSFGRYKVRGVLAEGGMGRLYVAEQTGIEGFAKIVAIKRILPHLADSAHFQRLFLTEARVAARLVHPNIVATFELGQTEGTYYIAMEYLPGEDLGAVFARCRGRTPMAIELVAALAQQSANGLHYAHELSDTSGRPVGIVHRDVNPSNIFVTYHGVVKLLDFGIVKGPNDGRRTSPGVFKGKYAYSAPEQVAGEPLDRRTDVFCLGIVLWESLTGERLFDGRSDAATLEAIRARPIPAPSAHRPEIPPELDAITLRALARDRDRRFQSASELAEALERWLAQRSLRPTSQHIGTFIESLFGAERAALKRSIAQGTAVEEALARLAELEQAEPERDDGATAAGRNLSGVRPRALWSRDLGAVPGTELRQTPVRPRPAAGRASTSGTFPAAGETAPGVTAIFGSARATGAPIEVVTGGLSDPSRTAAGRPGRRGTAARTWIAVGAVAGALGLALLGLREGGEPPRVSSVDLAPALGQVELRSDPPGAHVFVDGNPSGLLTPATLDGLRVGSEVELRVAKPGYAPVLRRVQVTAGAPAVHVVRLTESSGTVRLVGLSRRARVYLNDVLVDAQSPLSVPIGAHALRVEADDDIVFSRTITVKAGEQVVRVSSARRAP